MQEGGRVTLRGLGKSGVSFSAVQEGGVGLGGLGKSRGRVTRIGLAECKTGRGVQKRERQCWKLSSIHEENSRLVLQGIWGRGMHFSRNLKPISSLKWHWYGVQSGTGICFLVYEVAAGIDSCLFL